MKAILLLADAAQVSGGKLNVLGGGWSVTGPLPTPSALAIKIEVPWTKADVRHHFVLQLFTADGNPVMVDGPRGQPQPMRVDGEFDVGRSSDLPAGIPIDVPLAVNIAPLPLQPQSRFTWRLTVDGETHEDWQASFSTRALPHDVADSGSEH